MNPAAQHNRDAIILMNREYRALTGSDFYLYCSRPGDGQTRVVFQDGVKHSYAEGREHMTAKLAEARQAEAKLDSEIGQAISDHFADGHDHSVCEARAAERLAREGTPEPKPFSAGFERLYDEYRHQPHEAGGWDWEAWLKARTPVICGDCGDDLAQPEIRGGHVHLDDGTSACSSRSQANARRARQGRPLVGS
jgi:hypothetical protein